MLEKYSNKEASEEKCPRKWLIQEQATGGIQGGWHHGREQVASFPLALTLEPSEELPDLTDTWVVFYELLSTEQQKLFGPRMTVLKWRSSILLKGCELWPTEGKALIEEENTSAQWAGLHLFSLQW